MKKVILILTFMILTTGCEKQVSKKVNMEHTTDVIWAIEPMYDKASGFSSGLAFVSTGNTGMFIDKARNNSFNKTLQKINGEYTNNFTRWLPVVTEIGESDEYRLNITGKELIKSDHGIAIE